MIITLTTTRFSHKPFPHHCWILAYTESGGKQKHKGKKTRESTRGENTHIDNDSGHGDGDDIYMNVSCNNRLISVLSRFGL